MYVELVPKVLPKSVDTRKVHVCPNTKSSALKKRRSHESKERWEVSHLS